MSSDARSLKVTGPVFARFNRLKIKLAVTNDNQLSLVADIIAAMLTVSEKHYDELLTALAEIER